MAKRIFDVVGAAVLLVLAAPIIAVAAAVSLVAYGTSPFFAQDRVGRHGRLFRVYKIRTLEPSTPPSLPKAALVDHQPAWALRYLRAHHLDELPQLVNVLGGSMSLVGPRPEMAALHKDLPPDLAELRATVRPGITGLWQVSRAVEGMIVDHPEYDHHYVSHRTTRLDLWILWRTATGLLGRSPIESLAEVPAWTSARVVATEPRVDAPV